MTNLLSFTKPLRSAALASCAVLLLSCSVSAQTPAPAPNDQTAANEAINALAHKLLLSGVKANGLLGDGLKPWHLKIDFQYLEPSFGNSNPKPLSGSVEQWTVASDQWRRTFAGQPGHNFSEWSASRLEKYQSKPSHDPFDALGDYHRFARYIIDPLAPAANIHPDYQMEVKRGDLGGITLSCVSVVDPHRYAPDENPDEVFPTFCFDPDFHLRIVVSGKATVQFDDVQLFQGRAVAHDVKVRLDGALNTEMKVSVLEPLADANPDRIKPGKDAVPQPFFIEPGLPHPESVYEVAAALPIQPGGMPYRGTFNVPILIRKDGTVKILPGAPIYNQELKDALQSAIARWKYKPYLVDGQTVEAQFTVGYLIDGKPFVPSYQKPKP